jgi:hypothetical protein
VSHLRELIEAYTRKEVLRKIRAGKLRKVNTKTTEGAIIFRMMIDGALIGKRKSRPDTSIDLYDLKVP